MSKVIETWNDERFYPSQWGQLPSVTTILGVLQKFGLIPWAAAEAAEKIRPLLEMIKAGMVKIEEIDIDAVMTLAKNAHKEKKVEAMNIGTKMHEFIADYYRMVRNGANVTEARAVMAPTIVEANEQRILKAWDSFIAWDDEHMFMPIHIETPVASHFLYAGTMDFYGLDKKNRAHVIDWKSANSIYPETVMQVAAYSNALMETDPRVDRIHGWGCLRLGKEDGMPEYLEYSAEEIVVAFERFIKLTEYWHITNNWNAKMRAAKKEAKAKAKAEKKKVTPMSKVV